MANRPTESSAAGAIKEVIDTVLYELEKMEKMADKYQDQLSSALMDLSDVKVANVPEPTRIMPPDNTDITLPRTAMPEFTGRPNVTIPDKPQADFSADIDAMFGYLNGINSEVSPVQMPDYGTAPPELQLGAIPAAPSIAMPSSTPQRPNIDFDIPLPDAPSISLPELGNLIDLDIPEFNMPDIPLFDGKPPTTENIVLPEFTFEWNEPQYQSELLDDILNEIKKAFNGGTGIPLAVQEGIFNAARERITAETERAIQETTDHWAARGFSMPTGMLNKSIEVARADGRLKAAEVSREIFIESAKWEIEHLRFAIEKGVALEQLNQNLFSNLANRMFEVAKYKADSHIRVFEAQISLFNAQSESFKTLADIYRTKLQATATELDAQKVALEAAATRGQINQQEIEIYKTRIGAVQNSVEIYKALMQGAQMRSDTLKSKIDMYRADIQAYVELLGGEKVKLDVYTAQLSGEKTKADVYDSQVRAFSARVGAAQAELQGQLTAQQIAVSSKELSLKGMQAYTEAIKAKVSTHIAEVDTFKAITDANLNELRYNTEIFKAEVDAWRAEASVNSSEAEIRSKYADMKVRANIAYADVQIAEYKARLERAVQEANIALESAKALGQYNAQLAAGALSAANISAGIGGSHNSSYTASDSNNKNHNYYN